MVERFGRAEGDTARAEESTDILECLGKRFNIEYNKAYDYRKENVNSTEHAALIEMLQEEEFFNSKKNAEEQSPKDKVPGCSVPKAGEEPNDEDVYEMSKL